MHLHHAKVEWNLKGQDFLGNKYSRGHQWVFDGGTSIEASSSPQVVPVPLSIEAAVDPEEALVAAAASCHMLWFLSLAAKQKWVVKSYCDQATGIMDKNEDGQFAICRIELRPKIEFESAGPSNDQLHELHHEAHEKCFIANSLKSEIVVLDS